MTTFEGFADTDATFFKALAKHQKRPWFQAHKAEFEEGWNAPMKLLLHDVLAKIDAAYPHCDLDPPRVLRIFRDVRFSKDKTPYKTHISGILSVQRTGGIQAVPFALYVHFGTDTFVGAGHYQMDPPSLKRYRVAVADDARGKELTAILARLKKKGFAERVQEPLKRVPKGFDPDHPRAALLKAKGLTVTFPALPKKLLTSPKLVDWIAKAAKDAAPFVEWLVFATA